MAGARLLLAALLAACAPTPPLLVEGDACEVCRMAITDTRFGGAIVSSTGRTKSFDAVECLIEYLATADSSTTARVLVSDFETASLIDASTASFVEGSTVASPMGRSVIAVASRAPRDSIVARYGGTVVDLAALRRNLAEAGHERHGR